MAAASLHATDVMVFQSKVKLDHALKPLSADEISNRIAHAKRLTPLEFQYNPELTSEKAIPLRHLGVGNLLKKELYKTAELTVYYPEAPRVPHHLTIALNRREIKGIADVHEAENTMLFATIKKITEIYKTLSIQGFVIAQYDTPQAGHGGRYVVEIIPHLPGFHGMKNIVDKVDCNRYVLFREANLSPLRYSIKKEEIDQHVLVWRAAFMQEHPPLQESETKVKKDAYQDEAENILYHQLIELLQDKGGRLEKSSAFEGIMPTEIPDHVQSVTVEKCHFCDREVIQRQLVYEHESILVFYNLRKGAQAGTSFLLLPKRHTEKVYGLTYQEISQMALVRKALVDVLKEKHPSHEVIVYTQDDPSVGQSVFHSHEQIVAIDPQTIALAWTVMSLDPSVKVTEEEMQAVCAEFGSKLHQKITQNTPLKEAI